MPGGVVPNSRFVPIHGKESVWEQVTNYIPLLGEMIIYEPDSEHEYPRFKVGDGKNLPKDLPFAADGIPGFDPEHIVAERVGHTLTFGNGGIYQFDGSADVTVPVYSGDYQIN